MALTVLPSPGGVVTVLVRSEGNLKYAGFSDPDGNTWTLQEIAADAGQGTSEVR